MILSSLKRVGKTSNAVLSYRLREYPEPPIWVKPEGAVTPLVANGYDGASQGFACLGDDVSPRRITNLAPYIQVDLSIHIITPLCAS